MIAGVSFLAWQSRAIANVPWLGGGTPAISPGWAIAWWLIPIADLFMPFRSIADLERRTTVGAPRRALVAAWWLLFIGGNLADRIVSVAMVDATSTSDLPMLVAADLAALAAVVLSGGLAILVVLGIERSSATRAATLAAGGGWPAVAMAPRGPAWGGPDGAGPAWAPPPPAAGPAPDAVAVGIPIAVDATTAGAGRPDAAGEGEPVGPPRRNRRRRGRQGRLPSARMSSRARRADGGEPARSATAWPADSTSRGRGSRRDGRPVDLVERRLGDGERVGHRLDRRLGLGDRLLGLGERRRRGLTRLELRVTDPPEVPDDDGDDGHEVELAEQRGRDRDRLPELGRGACSRRSRRSSSSRS